MKRTALLFLGFGFLVLLWSSCSSGYGNKMTSESLDIYYPDKAMASYADAFGRFWTQEGMVGEKQQSIQLTKSNDTMQVRLILEPGLETESLPIEERYQLSELRYRLEKEVFDSHPVVIYVCEPNFKPIYQIAD